MVTFRLILQSRPPDFRLEPLAVIATSVSMGARVGAAEIIGKLGPSAQARFNALNTARIEASSMFVSTPAPQRDFPPAGLIWM
jgi:hypothetical protein